MHKMLIQFLKNTLYTTLFMSFMISNSQVEYGISTGLNSSRFTNEFRATNGSYFNTSSIGFKLGVFAEIPLKEKILFSPKLIFNQMGDREKDYGDVEERGLEISTIDYKLNYISIPLNIRFFNEVYFEVGPQLGILISDNNESLDLGDVDSSLDIGVNFEIGYKIRDFRISLNVYQGFSNIFEIERNPPIVVGELNVRNFALSFNVGYMVF
ncbi:porin family protein [Winogradskyella sp. MIT101101]|uniref:porin family protein n=1 Tax=Winogradskyella sp. MIT101101 TaxID=3098297 RepID=UPI00399A53B0